jgi:hypothetical protein
MRCGNRALAIASLLPLLSCASAEERSPMDGQWTSGNPQTDACAVVWTFDGDEFDLSRYCALDNGLVGLEINRGTFIIAGDRITLTKTRSTCPGGTREPVVLSFIVERQKLTLVSPSMVYTLAKGGLTLVAGGQASFGCFDATGVFTPGELLDVP